MAVWRSCFTRLPVCIFYRPSHSPKDQKKAVRPYAICFMGVRCDASTRALPHIAVFIPKPRGHSSYSRFVDGSDNRNSFLEYFRSPIEKRSAQFSRWMQRRSGSSVTSHQQWKIAVSATVKTIGSAAPACLCQPNSRISKPAYCSAKPNHTIAPAREYRRPQCGPSVA
jgi:hypothetical protein